MVTLDLSVLVSVSYIGLWSLTFIFVPWLVASLANGHLGTLVPSLRVTHLFAIMSCKHSANAYVNGAYLKYLGSSLKMYVLRLPIHRI